MFPKRFVTSILVTGFQVAALGGASGVLAAVPPEVVAPIALPPGATVSPLPNGGSSYLGDEGIVEFDQFIDFDFDNGLLAGVLRERVIQYSQVNEFHPYGGFTSTTRLHFLPGTSPSSARPDTLHTKWL
jgi:hypothetical protein